LHHRWCTRHLAENLFKKDSDKDNFALFEDLCHQNEVQFFKEKLEKLKTATDAQGRQWLRGLLREPEKWCRAYDDGGWRWESQTSNMAESFNSVLKGIRGMPVVLLHSHFQGWWNGTTVDMQRG